MPSIALGLLFVEELHCGSGGSDVFVLASCSAGTTRKWSITHQVLGARLGDREATAGLSLRGTMSSSLLGRLLDVREPILGEPSAESASLSGLSKRVFLLLSSLPLFCVERL